MTQPEGPQHCLINVSSVTSCGRRSFQHGLAQPVTQTMLSLIPLYHRIAMAEFHYIYRSIGTLKMHRSP